MSLNSFLTITQNMITITTRTKLYADNSFSVCVISSPVIIFNIPNKIARAHTKAITA